MIKEVLSRRFTHPEWPYPDLILVDGGKGQLHTLQKILSEMQLTVPVIALAKKKDNKEERLFLPGRKNYYSFKNDPHLLKLLANIRDEAHRFSRALHHIQERKRLFKSFINKKN